MIQNRYYPEVECQATLSDLYETEIVGVPDETDNYHFFRIAQGVVSHEDGKNYLIVTIIEVDHGRERALIQLPCEADSGANRLWVPFDCFRHETVEVDESMIIDRKIPTQDEHFYRIVSTTAGGAIFGGAVASSAGGNGGAIFVGGLVGGLVGLGISSLAACKAVKE
jgi:hypothetical protein